MSVVLIWNYDSCHVDSYIYKKQVLFEGDSISRKVILNRPEKLNILNYEMVRV